MSKLEHSHVTVEELNKLGIHGEIVPMVQTRADRILSILNLSETAREQTIKNLGKFCQKILDTSKEFVSAMSNEEKLRRLEYWQTTRTVHPLTCQMDEDGLHGYLEAQEREGQVVLVCPDCGHIQTNIPISCLMLD